MEVEGAFLTALDGIVHVNLIFALGVFMELAWSNPVDHSYGEGMFFYWVLSLGCFMLSSLVALSLKLAILLGRRRAELPWGRDPTSLRILKTGIVVAKLGLMFGCTFLVIALVNIIQTRLGEYGFIPQLFMAPGVILIYVFIILFSLLR